MSCRRSLWCGDGPAAHPLYFFSGGYQAACTCGSQSGYRTLRRATYSTLFALLACTGLRVSEAIRLRFEDITPDGLVIRRSKFRKSRLVPLHDTARAGLERYLEQRRPYAPFDDHVFVSLRRKPLLVARCGTRIPNRGRKIGLQREPGHTTDDSLVAAHLRGQGSRSLPGWPRSDHPAHGGAVDLSGPRPGRPYLLVSGSTPQLMRRYRGTVRALRDGRSAMTPIAPHMAAFLRSDCLSNEARA